MIALAVGPACKDAALQTVDAAARSDARDGDPDAALDGDVDTIDAGIDAGEIGSDAAPADAPVDTARPDAGPLGPDVPVLRSPWNGWASGSVHALADDPSRDPRRPLFRWERSEGATYYVVQLSSACEPATYRDCVLDDASATRVDGGATELVPEARLDVSTTAPVGRRYYWRVRACDDDDVCSAFSPMRYLDVARMKDDFDGDGYADVIAGTADRAIGTIAGGGSAWVFAGSASGLTVAPSVELRPPDEGIVGGFGRTVVAVGDVQADGFADLAVSEPLVPGDDGGVAVPVGRVHVYYGSIDGIPTRPDLTLDYPGPAAFAWFGSGLAGGGDLDADGYADLIVGAERRGAGLAFVYRGSPTGIDPALAVRLIPPSPVRNYGAGLASLGDVDADGHGDVAIGGFSTSVPSMHAGWAGLYRGIETALETRVSAVVIPEAEDSWIELGFFIAGALDANDDGFADVAISAPYMDRVAVNEGTILLFSGRRGFIADEPDAWLTGSDHTGDGYFGTRVATGDFDGDGFDDLVAGEPLGSARAFRAGRAWLIRGGPELASLTDPIPIDSPREQESAQFATVASADVNGDGRADLLVAAPFEDVDGTDDVGALYVFLGDRDGLSTSASIVASPYMESGLHFGASLD